MQFYKGSNDFRRLLSRMEDETNARKAGANIFKKLLIQSETLRDNGTVVFAEPFTNHLKPWVARMVDVPWSVYSKVVGRPLAGFQALLAPAGSYHLSFMFGPLLLESGIDE